METAGDVHCIILVLTSSNVLVSIIRVYSTKHSDHRAATIIASLVIITDQVLMAFLCDAQTVVCVRWSNHHQLHRDGRAEAYAMQMAHVYRR